MHQRRVVVTGMGAISPLGLDIPALWDGIRTARSGTGPITICDVSNLETRFGGEVKNFDPINYMDRKEARRNDRFIHFAIAAANEAIKMAGITATPDNAEDIGVVVGSGIGGIATIAENVLTLHEKGPGRVSPFMVPAMITNMAAGQISMMHGFKGPNFCPTSACATAAHAIGEAAEIIRRGAATIMIAGGSEAPITPLGIAGFNANKAVSTNNDNPTTASRPFDVTRDGFVLAEGGAIVVLESLESAISRGATIYAEIIGYGLSADAYHITSPAPGGEGAGRAMKMALRTAGIVASDVQYVNAHGTSTNAGDIAETMAIKTVFGEHAAKLAVSSSKSQLGHLVGAAGAIEAVICILAMQHSLIPATINLHTPDPACDLDYVPNTPRPGNIDIAVSNSFGFGGHNVSLALRRWSGQ
jgi:3-oxoacyl-[acyl-carrier-protein] synthase II